MPVENTGVRELKLKLVAEGIGVPTESGWMARVRSFLGLILLY